MFHLSNEDICLACNFAEQFWISGKTGHLELIRLKLSLEEMLLNYQAHLGRDTEFSLKYKKCLGTDRCWFFCQAADMIHSAVMKMRIRHCFAD